MKKKLNKKHLKFKIIKKMILLMIILLYKIVKKVVLRIYKVRINLVMMKMKECYGNNKLIFKIKFYKLIN